LRCGEPEPWTAPPTSTIPRHATPIEVAHPDAAAHEVRTFSDSDIITTAAMMNRDEIVVTMARSNRLILITSPRRSNEGKHE
jgi:hypothetical protein